MPFSVFQFSPFPPVFQLVSKPDLMLVYFFSFSPSPFLVPLDRQTAGNPIKLSITPFPFQGFFRSVCLFLFVCFELCFLSALIRLSIYAYKYNMRLAKTSSWHTYKYDFFARTFKWCQMMQEVQKSEQYCLYFDFFYSFISAWRKVKCLILYTQFF